ncbi:MAG: transcription elongation factor GreA [Candidatus Magasanikbacteria bacterium]|nr:transcription elongation factor GreA [Candidatus Magasanikbacteria bacterium]
MDDPSTQYVSATSLITLTKERDELKDTKIPEIAKRIDEAKQQGDLSENAEYHQAREDMSWAQGRLQELEQIINNAQIFSHQKNKGGVVALGSNLAVMMNGQTKTYTIVGPHEINPAKGFISNESPLGEAFLGHGEGDEVEVTVPSGKLVYRIVSVS